MCVCVCARARAPALVFMWWRGGGRERTKKEQTEKARAERSGFNTGSLSPGSRKRINTCTHPSTQAPRLPSSVLQPSPSELAHTAKSRSSSIDHGIISPHQRLPSVGPKPTSHHTYSTHTRTHARHTHVCVLTAFMYRWQFHSWTVNNNSFINKNMLGREREKRNKGGRGWGWYTAVLPRCVTKLFYLSTIYTVIGSDSSWQGSQQFQ